MSMARRGLPVEEVGEGEAAHEGDGAEEVDHVIDVEAEAGALLVADAGEGAVEAVAEPVEDEAEDDGEERAAMVAGARVEEAGGELGDEAERGELVGGEPTGGALGEPVEGALLDGGGEGVVLAASGCEGSVRGVHRVSPCSALRAERRVKARDSRGTLST